MSIDLKEFAGHLYGQMKSLKKHEITVQEAHAQTGLARQANIAIKHDWERAKKVAPKSGE